MQLRISDPTGSGRRFNGVESVFVYWDDLYLRGALDDFYLFETALSGDQVRALMRGETILSPDEEKE